MIDRLVLAMLPRNVPLRIHENASGFTCAICGCEQPAWCYRVTLPERRGKACLGCADDAGFTVCD